MATFDRSYGTTSARSAADSRILRDVRLDWSALFGGSLVGWGCMLLLSMIGMIIGLSVIDPFAARPAVSNWGAGLFGAGCAVVSSFIGSFMVVKLAGDRRRRESLTHGAVAWGMSMMVAGAISLFASGAAAFARTAAGNTAIHHAVRGQTVSLVETTGNGGLVAILATAGALLALVGSMLGALMAASRESGVPFVNEFRMKPWTTVHNGHHKQGSIVMPETTRRDETTIIPPTH